MVGIIFIILQLQDILGRHTKKGWQIASVSSETGLRKPLSSNFEYSSSVHQCASLPSETFAGGVPSAADIVDRLVVLKGRDNHRRSFRMRNVRRRLADC
jgi:hypothetical protein